MVEGSIAVECGEDGFDVGPGSFVFLPRDVPHAWDVTTEAATLLIVTVPGGFEDFMRDWHEAEASARGEVAARYGIELLHDDARP